MVGSDDDRPGFLDREKKSFSELDRMRRDKSSGPERTPRSAAGRARAEAAAKQYLKEIDGLFSKGKGGAETERLERAMRDARGTPGLAAACRAWLDAVGPPEATSVVSLFLDSGDRELVLEGLAALLRARRGPPRCDAGSAQPAAHARRGSRRRGGGGRRGAPRRDLTIR
jgi:hypothetical protein